ncbi:MAG TPA: mechanosensitive ion channel family protein [Burkholderiales bacterium]
MAEEAAAGYLAGRIDAVREHLSSLAAAAPRLGAEFGKVGDELAREWQTRAPGSILALIAACVLLGYLVRAGYHYWVRGAEVRDATVRERLRSIGLRFAREVGGVAAFAIGSAAVVLIFEWPARTREAVLGFLAAFVVVWLVIVASRALLSPREARLRILPASDPEAAFWHSRIVLFASWFAFGWVIKSWLLLLGMDLPALRLVIYALGLGLLAIAIEAFWRRSRLAALYFVLLWVLWSMRAFGALWLAVVAAALPVVMRLVQRGADHVLRPPGTAAAEARGVAAATIGRALRALAIIGAAYLLVDAFGLDVDALAASDAMGMRLARGAVHALVIVLIADVAWMVCAALIDQKLASVRTSTSPENEHRDGRLRTLLPIVRGTLAVVLIVMTALMVLSALGIQVGPLLAGAGVLGLAVGFGAQTLVRDMFSKFFYLLDDAFRIGEYIQSGNYKGTVEHLGARSIRLRHHRGPVYTIPYGILGAVQNMSRDWVIDKLQIGITYDSDLEKARKLIKKIGQELAQDPALAPNILETLKMQGVEDFGDFAIKIRMKMMTKPGEQFVIRRKAFGMIKKAFDANGIKFAYPTVQVAGPAEGAVAAAAAQQALKPAP